MHKKEPWEWGLIAGLAFVALLIIAGGVFSYSRDSWDISVSLDVAQSPGQMFDILTSPEGRVAWQYGVMAVTPLVGDDNQVGSTRFVYMRVDRTSWQMEETLLVHGRPTRWHVRQVSDDKATDIRFEIGPTPTGSHIAWRETHSFANPWERVWAFFTMRTQKAHLESGLEKAARIVADGR